MLTPEQHQQIERYIAGKGVHYYDVQMEIADHLGEQVLAAMQNNGLEFETALREQGAIFSKDWPDIVKYKTRYLRLKILKSFLEEMGGFFAWPRIGVTLLIIAAMYALNQTPFVTINTFPYHVVSFLLPFINLTYLKRDRGLAAQGRKNDSEIFKSLLGGRHKNLLGGKQFGFVSAYATGLQVLYVLFIWTAIFISPGFWNSPADGMPAAAATLLNQIIFYSFPLMVVLDLSWIRTRQKMLGNLWKNYPEILSENRTIKEILADRKQESIRRRAAR